MRYLVLFILLIAIIGGGVYIYSKRVAEAPATLDSGSKVNFKQTDLSSGGKLPAGFPSDIPVETVNVKESYSAGFGNATQYSLSYVSSKSASALWDIYSSYMTQNGYAVNEAASSKSLGQITGKKGLDSLSVVITSHNGSSLVQLSFLHKQ